MIAAMHAEIAAKKEDVIALCRRFDVARLEIFGSAARAADFNPDASDVDFLVEFPPRQSVAAARTILRSR